MQNLYSTMHSMVTYRIPKEQLNAERKRLHGLEKKYGRVVAYAAVRDGDHFQMFVENVNAGDTEHWTLPDKLLDIVCKERGVDREEAKRLVLEGEWQTELGSGGQSSNNETGDGMMKTLKQAAEKQTE